MRRTDALSIPGLEPGELVISSIRHGLVRLLVGTVASLAASTSRVHTVGGTGGAPTGVLSRAAAKTCTSLSSPRPGRCGIFTTGHAGTTAEAHLGAVVVGV